MLPKPFKKLHTDIKESLENLNITTPTPFQISSIPVIKSGSNVFCTAPKNSGKTTTLIITTLQKLQCKAEGMSPRAIVLVENSKKASDIYDTFLKYTTYTSLRVYAGLDSLHIDVQKSEILEGVDILVTTPKSFRKLLQSNGISTSQISIFNIDEAEFLTQNTGYADILFITQGVKKCQFVLYTEKMPPKLKGLESYFMEYAKTISI